MRMRAVLCGAVALLLAGCASFDPVEGNMPIDVGDGITVDPQIPWANAVGELNGGMSGTVWTIDGFGLDALRFLTGVTAGSPLLRIDGVSTSDVAPYRADMQPGEVMDLIAATLGKAGNQEIRTDGLKAAPFGDAMGFRFDLTYATADGLEMKGLAVVAQRRNKLDVILFTAPSEYYYDRYAPTVERIFTSIRAPNGLASATAPS